MRLILLFIFLLMLTPSSVTGADITTFVAQEALMANESGSARTSETLSIGLPLPESGGYTDTSSFGLTGSTVGQFKITGWWPNGNAKWVTVDLQTDLIADQVKSSFALTDSGSGNFGGSDLATDNGTTIVVDTGVAVFTIKKANFNVLDSVVVDGSTIVTSGHSGGFQLVDTGSVVYSSVNDTDSAGVIEDNGPVKAVIVSSGTLEDSSNNRFCDYEVRFTFYKGKSYVTSIVSLRNAIYADYQASVTNNKEFYSSELRVPLSLGANKTVLLTNKDTEITRSLGASDTAYVYQGHSAHPLLIPMETSGGADGWEPPIPKSGTNPWVLDPNYFGVELAVGVETIQALGTEATWTQGYADLSDSTGKGLTVAMRYMAQNYPAGFDINGNGQVAIELYSKRNNNTLCKLGWSKWDTREVLWDFHSTVNNKKESFSVLQWPLIGRAPFTYYRDNKAFGTDKLVTTAEEIQYYTDEGETPTDFSDPEPTNDTTVTPWRGYFRLWARALGGDSNFIDTPASDLLDWIRTGNAGYYVFASQRLLFDAYSGPRRSDDWQFQTTDSYAQFKNGYNMSGGSFDMEHHYIQGLPWLYFMTGNQFLKTSCQEDAEWNQRMYLFGAADSTLPTSPYFRAWSRQTLPLSIYYDFNKTINEPIEDYADTLAASFTYLIDSREDTANIPDSGIAYRGRNMDRGFIYWDTTISADNQRIIWSFFHTQIHFNAAYTAYSVLDKWSHNYPRLEDFGDYLTGLSQFIYNEYITCSDVIWGGKCGFEYAYRPYMSRIEVLAGDGSYADIMPYPASRPYVWLRQKTGEDHQDTADKAATWPTKNKRQSSDLQEQALYHQHIYNDITPDVGISVNVVNNGGGSYTLSWIVPADVTAYQIKYSEKLIVDWLGYDRDTKLYTNDPSTNIAFFAATNIIDEPTPAAPGSTQEHTIVGLAPTGIQFAMMGSYNSSIPQVPLINAPAYLNGSAHGLLNGPQHVTIQ